MPSVPCCVTRGYSVEAQDAAQIMIYAWRGERSDATGEVVLYAATLRHDPPNPPEGGR